MRLRTLPVVLSLVSLLACRGEEEPRARSLEGTRSEAPSAETFQAVVDAVLPAIVFIQAEARHPPALPGGRLFPGMQVPSDELMPVGIGSGVLYSADGYILTNNHVVQQAERVTVTLYDRRVFEARVVARDPSTDVAVVQIPGGDFPFAPLGNSEAVRVGDWVLALGSPLGLQFTVTAGIVSGTGRTLGILRQDRVREETQAAPLEHFIQTDAAVNPGNSGGPLVSLGGEVIGINTAIASPTGAFAGYGFAIPSNLASRVADQLIRFGEVRRPYLGVGLDEVTAADAEVYGLEVPEGAQIKYVEEGSPAAGAGLEIGDVIRTVAGVQVRTVGDFQVALAQLDPGTVGQLGVVRFGERLEVPVRLGMVRSGIVPEPEPEPEGPTRLGFAVQGQAGAVVVTAVRPLSAAARAGVRPGQVILRVNQREVQSPAGMLEALEAAGRDVVSLIVQDPQIGRTIINYRPS
jgi:serine protease Do